MSSSRDLLGVAESLPTPIVVIAMDGTIAAANRAFTRLVSPDGGNVVGRPLRDLLLDGGGDFEHYMRAWARSGSWSPGALTFPGAGGRRQKQPAEGMRFVSPDDGRHFVLLRLDAKPAAAETFLRLNQHIANLTTEVGRRKRLEIERLELLARERAAREQAELANRLKDDFLATLSHELRTPLNAIVGWAGMLNQHPGSQENTLRGLSVIDRNARMLTKMIEDLLDVSRITSGKLRLDIHPVDLGTVVPAAIDAVRPAAANKGISVTLDAQDQTVPVLGDADRLQQIVWNLLANAIKFTPDGGRVFVALDRTASHAHIVVTDTGQGIAPEFLPHVFDRFRQADATPTRAQAGLGLGLALAKALCEAHGGRLSASSPGSGQGATFTVHLPVNDRARATAVDPASAADGPDQPEMSSPDRS